MKHRVRSHSLRFATTVALAASVCVGGVGGAGSASADEYSMQIGAFEKPEPSLAEAAEKVGKLYPTRNGNGLTRGEDTNLLANVPAEFLDRTVLLDGHLHVIEGNRFILLREYLAGSR